MENQAVPTPNEIWKILKEVSLSQKETDRLFRESKKETERLFRKSQQEEETRRKEEETRRKEEETRRKEEETRRKEEETRRKELDHYIKENSREMKRLKNIFSNKWGELVESLVSGPILKMLQKRNIKVTGMSSHITAQYKDSEGQTKECEIDIMARNGQELVAVEVKSTLGAKEVDRFLDVLKRFTLFFPEYRDKKIYGAVAYLKLYQSADRYAIKKGLFVIKATGDSAYIVNKDDFKPLDFSPKI